ncbi:hypothetical protein CDAR_544571 [Caerostris darwini]|uniref:Uncharacterized protein n=1 Tax=Caerostris darwini TaxID=1538125 RepID=A0AAV4QFT9_9ARAC|nr:hypothetical protein CDAR_544571 [Caerostris darwini]
MITKQLPMLFRHFDDAHTRRRHKPLRQQLLKGERGTTTMEDNPDTRSSSTTPVLISGTSLSHPPFSRVPSHRTLLSNNLFRPSPCYEIHPWLLLLHGE